MQKLNEIAEAIKLAIDFGEVTEFPRAYLGMSQLGSSCKRKLWFYFRWANIQKYKKKSKRIFARGNIEENRVIQYWKDIDLKIKEEQVVLSDFNGHLRGHCDAHLFNLPDIENKLVVGEIKTMANKYFTPLAKNGLKKSNLAYYVQAQVYCEYSNAEYCLHSTTNKDNEELYIELIKFEGKDFIEPYKALAKDVIYETIPLKRVSDDPTYWECGWCDFYNQCHLGDKFLKTCRTCQYASPDIFPFWKCSLHDKQLTIEEQKEACPKYDSLKV